VRGGGATLYAWAVDTPRADRAFFLVSGPMAVGRSTVARRFERGVRVEGFTVAVEGVIAGPSLIECMRKLAE
jgi:hypothetical protein